MELPGQESSLLDAVQSAFGRGREDFTDYTIVGSEINRIAHVFFLLKADEKTVILNYQAENYRAYVEKVQDYQAVLRVPNFGEVMARRCRLKFEVANVLYQFEVAILHAEPERITIRVPAYIQSAKRRKYTRIMVDDLFMKYALLYRPLYGRRGIGQLLENRYPHLVGELARDEPDLALINRIITHEIAEISPDFEIVYSPDPKPGSLMESVVREEKKTMFIRDTTRAGNYYEPTAHHGLINYRREYVYLARQSSDEEAQKYFENIRREDTKNFLLNYVCAPLMIFDKVVGHMFVYTTVLDRRWISDEQAQRIELMATLLSYAMSKTVVARAFYRDPITRVINVSLGGLLFEVTNKVVFDYLTDHDHLKIRMPIRHHELEVHGEITRYYPTKAGYNVGVRFYRFGPDDYRVLENFIFERGRISFRHGIAM